MKIPFHSLFPAFLFLSMLVACPAGTSHGLDPEVFANPPAEYRPIDCWWWDGGEIQEEKLREQIVDMHAKGVGGTWLYPRYGANQPMSGDPGFWTEGWWDRVRYVIREQEQLGMTQWANDWLGRLDKAYFQNQLRAERDTNPELWGSRLVSHIKRADGEQSITLKIPDAEQFLMAAAFRTVAMDDGKVDGESRIDLGSFLHDRELSWTPPAGEWLVLVITREPHDLDYLSPVVANRWIQIYFEKYEQQLGRSLGKVLTAYGPDERSVLDGNILYSDEVIRRFRATKGYDPIGELAALFVDIGPRTDKVRCDYYDVMISLLEENLYRPIEKWLHDRGMKQVTIATWGREDMLGQTRNYGDFFRLMRHFDIPGNEDSQESGAGAFIDSKLSSSIAHLNRRQRVAVCAYWGTGWGFTQEENLARTNVNFALGATLYNTHGVLYSLMSGRNEFVPPEVHFYQPYWKTWKRFTDQVARTSYALSQGSHQADVALLYPLSTLHANWHSGSEFDAPAHVAQTTCFGLAKAIHRDGLDFDFIDETSLTTATAKDGRLQIASMNFPVLLFPTLSTIRLVALEKAVRHVENGGLLVLLGEPPSASVENGRDDPRIRQTWMKLLGDYKASDREILERSHPSGGKTILVRGSEEKVGPVIRSRIHPDVVTDVPDVLHTHQRIGEDDLYLLVNNHAEARELTVNLSASGTPEIWDPATGIVKPHHRFERHEAGTKLRLSMGPREGVLILIRPGGDTPAITQDNLMRVDAVTPNESGYNVHGIARHEGDLHVRLEVVTKKLVGQIAGATCPKTMLLEDDWECTYRPTMNNKWGDFRYPPSDRWIGPEAPRMMYRAEPANGGEVRWEDPSLAEESWEEVQVTYGPYWQLLDLSENADTPSLRAQLIEGKCDPRVPIEIDGTLHSWQPYEFSWKYGSPRADVHQLGGDGLGPVSPDFLVFDPPNSPTVRYMMTNVYSAKPQSTFLHFGNARDRAPRQAWVNGKAVIEVGPDHDTAIAKVDLHAGWNRILLCIDQSARNHFAMFAVFHPSEVLPPRPRYLPISQWYDESRAWRFDPMPEGNDSIGWYRFLAPPGARSAVLHLAARSVQAWIDGKPAPVSDDVLTFPDKASGPKLVALRVKHEPGRYGGAAFDGPIGFECETGKIPAGDWSNVGLRYYSGGVLYRRTIDLAADQVAGQVVLDLGNVRTSAEVTVNGQPCGVRLTRPFQFDISESVHVGENTIEVEVLNTLANFMSDQPTKYVYDGQTVSGLLGPASLTFARKVSIPCRADATATPK